jgi:hypothetical protein
MGLAASPSASKRHPRYQELTGRRFGRLVVLSEEPRRRFANGNSTRMWRLRCDCGTEKSVQHGNLMSRGAVSCGCITADIQRALRLRHGHAVKGSTSREYETWLNIRGRCRNPKHVSYERYGARGIKVCPEWDASFEAFLANVGPRPDGHSIERIDNSKDYEPGNVRWATTLEQANNKRNSRRLTVGGITRTIPEWGRLMKPATGVTKTHIWARIILGWSAEDAVLEPLRYRMGQGQPRLTRTLKRQAALRRATPSWLTPEQRTEIRGLYAKARETGATVDHILPLQGRLAWGLHVPWNLQVTSLKANMVKGNRL